MKIVLMMLSFLGVLSACKAQQVASTASKPCEKAYDSILQMMVYSYADQMPEFANGENFGITLFINKNLHFAGHETPHRSIFLIFVVMPDGTITNASIYGKNKNEWDDKDKELIRMLLSMPPWKPGACNGVKVPVKTNLPIHF